MRTIRVRLAGRSYPIIVGSGLIARLGRILKAALPGRDLIVITNPKLRSLFGAVLTKTLSANGLSCRFILVPDSEKAKSDRTVTRVVNAISSSGAGTAPAIVALGGGVVGDVAGFIASVYRRGIPYVQVPTTLLAQVDSAIGGKVAIDLRVAKNLVGAVYQPRLVVSDIGILKTLPARQVASGMAEVIKYGVIGDRALFCYLESHLREVMALDRRALEYVVLRCSAIKARIVERDEYDRKGIRMVLNYGHTIGHAIEAAAGYSRRFTHGEAVAAGMVAANRMAVRRGMLTEAAAGRIERLIRKAGLPARIRGVERGKVYRAHLHDKKFSGAMNRFVLPAAIGDVRVVSGLRDGIIRAALEECEER